MYAYKCLHTHVCAYTNAHICIHLSVLTFVYAAPGPGQVPLFNFKVEKKVEKRKL